MSPKCSHFSDISLLVSDYLAQLNVALGYDGNEGTLEVMFGWGTKRERNSKLRGYDWLGPGV